MKHKRIGLGIATLTAGSLLLAGCAGGSEKADGAAKIEGNAAAIISVNSNEPQKEMIPANTSEVGGSKVLQMVFSGLVYYAEDGSVKNEVADSIESSDSQNYTIKLKKDWKFTDGTPVTAASFVKAWNDGAQESNNYMLSSFYEDIEGYGDKGAKGDMSGLKIVDDYTFTVKLKHPASDFKTRLGYLAFFPLPEAYFKDKKAFGQNPIGNGPYKMASDKAWEHNVKISLVKNDAYTGERKAKNGGITFKLYEAADAAYADVLGNNLDVIDTVPTNALKKFRDDLGERSFLKEVAVFQSFTIPQNLPHFGGEEGKLRRQALSMAINRDELTKVVLAGLNTPATDFTSPSVKGYQKSLQGGDVLKYNPTKAKELWAEADKIAKWDGKFELAYNGAGHQAWVDAVTNNIKNTLGIEAAGKAYPTFKELRNAITKREIKTAFRSGWQADYPGVYNFLEPLYTKGASSNDGDYDNPEFEALLQKGISATSDAEAEKSFTAAQEILVKDLPAIPLWYGNAKGGYAEGVGNVQIGWNSVPLYYNIVKK